MDAVLEKDSRREGFGVEDLSDESFEEVLDEEEKDFSSFEREGMVVA